MLPDKLAMIAVQEAVEQAHEEHVLANIPVYVLAGFALLAAFISVGCMAVMYRSKVSALWAF